MQPVLGEVTHWCRVGVTQAETQALFVRWVRLSNPHLGQLELGVPANDMAAPGRSRRVHEAVAPSRDDLAARFIPDEDREELRALIGRAAGALNPVIVNGSLGLHARVLVRGLIKAPGATEAIRHRRLADVDVARAGAGLRHVAIRDAVWAEIDQRHDSNDDFWLDLALRLPVPYDAAPLFLYAWSAWRHGNGALANIAVNRALTADQAYSAAHLLRRALTAGLNPDAVPRALDGVSFAYSMAVQPLSMGQRGTLLGIAQATGGRRSELSRF